MKKSLFKKITSLLMATALIAVSLTACKTSDSASNKDDKVYRTVDEIKESGVINIGVFSDKSPFGYVDENGNYAGYDVYFANQIAKDLGVEVNFVSTEAANRIEYLQTGKVDIILANFTVTDERKEEVDFSLPYMNVSLGVVSPSDAVVESLDDLGKNDQVIAFSLENEGYTVGIPSLGDADTIAPAVTKGNESLLNWLNEETVSLASKNFFHEDYEATLKDTYGEDYEDTLVVESTSLTNN